MSNTEHPSPEKAPLLSHALELLIVGEYWREEEIIRGYGTLDKAYAQEYTNGMLPPLEACSVRPYRDVVTVDPENSSIEIEAGGGLQIGFNTADDLGVHTWGVRVPVYELSNEGAVRPVGRRFDDIDEAWMVACQADDWVAFAHANDFALHPDLTIHAPILI